MTKTCGRARSLRGLVAVGSSLLLPLVTGVACAGGRSPEASVRVELDTIGDTVVVRTVAGSAWGGDATLEPEVAIGRMEGDLEYLMGSVSSIAVADDGTIYVLDGQGPELRAYTPDGLYIRTIGQPGEGPGELKQPGAVAVLSDGRIVVRDPGNSRIQAYAPDGTPAGAWGVVRGGFITSNPMPVDHEDNMYITVFRNMTRDFHDWKAALVRVGSDGVAGDTLDPPETGYEAPSLEARSKNSIAMNGVPFFPSEQWMLHPDGYFVHGVSDAYRFTLLRPGTPIRVEKTWEPVPVAAGEKDQRERQITSSMRHIDPNWSWNGPAIPDTRPAYERLYPARDGRIWVEVAAPSVKVEDTDYDPSDPNAIPNEWRDRFVLDVFEGDGTYLGRVVPPEDFRTRPQPVFDGDHVWAVTADDLGVQRVVRYRLILPGGGV